MATGDIRGDDRASDQGKQPPSNRAISSELPVVPGILQRPNDNGICNDVAWAEENLGRKHDCHDPREFCGAKGDQGPA